MVIPLPSGVMIAPNTTIAIVAKRQYIFQTSPGQAEMAAELFGVRMLGRVMGIVLTADGVAEAVVPMLVASIRDSTHSYWGGFAVLIALAVVGAGAVALLPQSKGHDETPYVYAAH